MYAVATVDRCLKTIDEQLHLDAAEQDSNKLEQAFAAADCFARRLERQLNKRNFICGSKLVYWAMQVAVKKFFFEVTVIGLTFCDSNLYSYTDTYSLKFKTIS